MESKVNYTLVGLFVVLLSAFLIVIAFWLSARSHSKEYHSYLVYVPEEVTGLSAQGVVRFNGVPVGYVKAIEIDPRNPKLVRLNLSIEAGTPITIKTTATLKTQGITGVLYVNLEAQAIKAPLLTVKLGEQYPIIPYKTSFMVQLSQVLIDVTKNIKKLSDDIGKVFDEPNRIAIENSLQDISKFTKTMSKNTENISTIAHNSAIASKALPQLMKQLNESLQSIHLAAQAIKKTSGAMTGTMNQGTLLMGNISNQLLPITQQTMSQLNSVGVQLSVITQELQHNPAMLIRGKSEKAKGPGER